LKKTAFISFILFFSNIYGQNSLNIEFLDNWSDNTLISNSSGVRYSDCIGFERNGIEYAAIGSTEGIHFFKLTEENRLNEVDFIQGGLSATSVYTRDLKIYDDYLFAVCDQGGGLQVIDLTFLPDSAVMVMQNDSTFAQVHNLFLDNENALMYACSINPKVGGILQGEIPLQVYSIADPLNPVLVYSGPAGLNEVHDAHVRNSIAYLNCGFDGLRVYDFTNPSAPILLQNLNIYPNQGFNHQGWMSPNGRTYIFSDETLGSRLKKCEVNVDNTVTIKTQFGTNFNENSVAHNVVLTNDFAFVAYYNEGLRIYDSRYSLPKEIAFYDTYLQESNFKLNGVWGIYAEYSSGRIIISDRQSGLFLLNFDRPIFTSNNNTAFTLYPNPAESAENLVFKLNDSEISSFTATVIDCKGKKLFSESFNNQNYAVIQSRLSQGAYFVQLVYLDQWGDEIKTTKKLIVQ